MFDNYVFVYGSLKRGFHNNRLLAHCDFIGEFVTKDPDWQMCSFGAFPGVIFSYLDGYHVKGDLYCVDEETFEALDRLESNGQFYTRSLIELEGFDKPVWMYILNDDYETDNTNGIVFDEDNGILVWKRS